MLNMGNRIVNSWLYPISDGLVLIDTGYENGFERFQRQLVKANIDLHSIRYVFLTHAHDDHAGFLNQLLSLLPEVRVIMSREALPTLYGGQNSFEGGCTGRIALLFCQVMKLFGKGAHRFPPLRPEFKTRCIFLTDENREELEGTLNGKIINTPGHTDDSISLLLKDGELFCGDAAMNGLPSLHRVTIWAGNKAAFVRSWELLIQAKPTKIYPGHGKPFECRDLERNLPYVRKIKLLPLAAGSSPAHPAS